MTTQDRRCPVCFEALRDWYVDHEHDIERFDCPRCSRFRVVSDTVGDVLVHEEPSTERYPTLGPEGSPARANLSAWLREHPDSLLTTERAQDLCSLGRPPVLEIVDEALLALGREIQAPGQDLDVNTPRWRGQFRTFDYQGVRGWAQLMEDLGYIQVGELTHDNPVPVTLAAGGWERLHELQNVNPDSPQGFVAMWFDDGMTELYDGVLSKAIEAAGYRPHRVDRREFAGRIDDEIVAQIRRSRFVVADFTGHRGGVYWEAGLAEGLGLPVFFTCREDAANDLHFDVRQQNTIRWTEDGLEELGKRLQARIEAELGRGPLATTLQAGG